jgi:hypothetical protein
MRERAESQLNTNEDLRFQFCDGTFGMGEKLDELFSCMSGLAFRDVGWNRNSRAPHLRDKSEPLCVGKRLSQLIDFLHQSDAFLPNEQVSIALYLLVAILGFLLCDLHSELILSQ